MSAGREFQVDGAATEKARRASSLCIREMTSIGASEERRARGGARVCTGSLRYVGVAVVRNHTLQRQLLGQTNMNPSRHPLATIWGSRSPIPWRMCLSAYLTVQ